MASPLLVEADQLTCEPLIYDRSAIYARMPHRFEFQLLDGITRLDLDGKLGLGIGYHDCLADEWWVRCHFPDRPIFPGVLQLEAAAQLVAFISRNCDRTDVFVGFGGVEACRFREPVVPPCRYHLVANLTENRSRRVQGDVQGILNGKLVFEARIIGMAMPLG